MLQNKNSEFCAPLTSFDWNETDPKRLGTSSIDTTCTIWDIEASQQGSHGVNVLDIIGHEHHCVIAECHVLVNACKSLPGLMSQAVHTLQAA
jgi:hypothetical protein